MTRSAAACWTGFERYSTILGSDFDDRIVIGDARSFGDRGDIQGGLGDDSLIGGRRANEFFGEEGDDELHGPRRRRQPRRRRRRRSPDRRWRRATGSPAAQARTSFIFSAAASHSPADQPDLIADLADDDLISLWPIDADSTRDGDQKFELVGGPTLQAGRQLWSTTPAGHVTVLRLEIDGGAGADMVVLHRRRPHRLHQLRAVGVRRRDPPAWASTKA